MKPSISFGSTLLRVLPLLLLAVLLSTWPSRLTRVTAQATSGGVLGAAGMRGVSFVPTSTSPFGSDQAAESLRRLAATGANWVAVVVPFHANTAHDSTFFRAPGDPDDAAVGQVVAQAHSLGLKVMLQPIVLLNDGVWNGYFYPDDRPAWFANYQNIIAEYAHLAQQVQADVFCFGTEFFTMTVPEYSPQWRGIIAAVRGNYSGPVTYSANWGDKKTPEYATIDWWDQLDYIGISAYFPLAWNDFYTPTLVNGWMQYQDPFGANAQGQTFRWFDAINAVHTRWNKPVLFTKIGFASYANSPARWDVTPDPFVELSVQANGYDATMQVWGRVDWMQGIFWSPWYSTPGAAGPTDTGESPQNKPAEQTLHAWYSGQR